MGLHIDTLKIPTETNCWPDARFLFNGGKRQRPQRKNTMPMEMERSVEMLLLDMSSDESFQAAAEQLKARDVRLTAIVKQCWDCACSLSCWDDTPSY